jgi:hypothetical protein
MVFSSFSASVLCVEEKKKGGGEEERRVSVCERARV